MSQRLGPVQAGVLAVLWMRTGTVALGLSGHHDRTVEPQERRSLIRLQERGLVEGSIHANLGSDDEPVEFWRLAVGGGR